MNTKAIMAWIVIGALAGCAAPEPPPPFDLVYSTPDNNITGNQVAAMSPEMLANLAPAAGGNVSSTTDNHSAISATKLRESENERAIREDSYQSTKSMKFIPSDY